MAVFDEVVAADDGLDGECDGGRDGVRLVGVAVVEATRALSQDVDDALVHQDTGDGGVPASEAFADGADVWSDVLLLEGEEGAGAADAAHDFVHDEQDAVAITDGAHGLKVAFWSGDAAGSGTDDGLGDEGDDFVAADAEDFVLEFLG